MVYRDRTINPWENGPARAILYESLLRAKLSEWPLRNQTDLLHGGSTAISFLLHPGEHIGVANRDGLENRINRLGGECFWALLEISHLGPYARVRFTKETFNNDSGELGYYEQDNPYRPEDYHFLNTLRLFLEEENIEILQKEILDHPVPDIELDVTRKGNATVYHCLFDEE
ncbi:MAG TPA: hypothetical protein VGB30_07060 [bacterium]|jgi:hypothetical protein